MKGSLGYSLASGTRLALAQAWVIQSARQERGGEVSVEAREEGAILRHQYGNVHALKVADSLDASGTHDSDA